MDLFGFSDDDQEISQGHSFYATLETTDHFTKLYKEKYLPEF